MRIGIPKEIKDREYRVALTPDGARALAAAGREVRVQAGAGAALGFADVDYAAAGAVVVPSAEEAYAADLVAKVKEPQPAEFPLLRTDQVLFSYLHLAAAPDLARELLARRTVAIAMETVTAPGGKTPLLTPMSQIAGVLAVQMGAWALTMGNGGSGTLLAEIPGVASGRVVVLGGGTVGGTAARLALAWGADVTVLDRDPARLAALRAQLGERLATAEATPDAIGRALAGADLAVGAVLVPGREAPKIITREMVRGMRRGAVLVDVAIDQGGCAETSRPTTHSHPLYVEEGVVHYCVSNMPAACSRTATLALTAASLPYLRTLAERGWRDALLSDPGLADGLQICRGRVTHRSVAEALGEPYAPAASCLAPTDGQL